MTSNCFSELINYIETSSLMTGFNKEDTIKISQKFSETKESILLEIKITSNKKQETICGEMEKNRGNEFDIKEELCKRMIIQVFFKYFLT